MERLKFIFKVSFRNLFRQKRRNFFLGIGIALGMMILIIVNSFSHGISDLIFNKIVVYAYGHIQVQMTKGDGSAALSQTGTGAMIPDKERIVEAVTNTIKDVKHMREDVTAMTRAIGNGKSDMLVVVGIHNEPGWFESLKVVGGNLADYTNSSIENPTIMGSSKAEYLNIKAGDTVKIKLSTKTGQQQTGRLTVVAITKNQNEMMDMAAYTRPENVKKLMGFTEHEAGAFVVVLNKPLQSIPLANKLHDALKPNLAVVDSTLERNGNRAEAYQFSFWDDPEKINLLTNAILITRGSVSNGLTKNGVMISQKLASRLGIKPGDKFSSYYDRQLDPGMFTNDYTVDAVFNPKGVLPENSLLVGGKKFFDKYYENIPAVKQIPIDVLPKTNSVIYTTLAPEYRLLDRSPSAEDYTKKYKDLKKTKWYGFNLDVITMYEIASMFLKLESSLNLITFIAVMILFFIILIGVINTLQMTIRERTREIGTTRAVGMQQSDVRNTFLMETFFLTMFSLIAGVILGFVMIGLISLIPFDNSGALSMLLVNKHLYFVPNVISILSNFVIIMVIAIITALFPARKAAKLPVADALRHYE